LLTALKERNNLDTSLVEDLIVGYPNWGQGGNVAKVAAQCSNYGDHLSAVSQIAIVLD
jgi:acetyl-CoA C-acetyltransferase